MAEREMPTGVKVISVLYYIGAAFILLINLLMINTRTSINELLTYLILSSEMFIKTFIFIGTPLYLVIRPMTGIIFLLSLGVFGIFIGRGLWKGQHWARIAAIVLSTLFILESIYFVSVLIYNVAGDILFGVTGAVVLIRLIVSLLIGGYLAFAHEVKEAFA